MRPSANGVCMQGLAPYLASHFISAIVHACLHMINTFPLLINMLPFCNLRTGTMLMFTLQVTEISKNIRSTEASSVVVYPSSANEGDYVTSSSSVKAGNADACRPTALVFLARGSVFLLWTSSREMTNVPPTFGHHTGYNTGLEVSAPTSTSSRDDVSLSCPQFPDTRSGLILNPAPHLHALPRPSRADPIVFEEL